MSKSIAINAGSSSLKFQLFNMPQEEVVAKGLVERMGLGDSIFSISYGDDQKFEVVEDIPNHEVAVEKIIRTISSSKHYFFIRRNHWCWSPCRCWRRIIQRFSFS